MTGSFFMSIEPKTTPKRAIVYIDGFNLYYGALKGSQYKWLNLEKYFHLLLPNDDIQKIRYFTARVVGKEHAKRQDAYLAALATLPLVDVVLGNFKSRQIEGRCVPCPRPAPRFFTSYEEKHTDVNIAIWMLHDAMKNLCDRLILVTGDSDLVPAVAMTKRECPDKEILVYIPARNKDRGAAVELRNIADKNKTLPLQMLHASLFPPEIPTPGGFLIKKPVDW
jgi:uncharacterized LabA/DUF88 family protein